LKAAYGRNFLECKHNVHFAVHISDRLCKVLILLVNFRPFFPEINLRQNNGQKLGCVDKISDRVIFLQYADQETEQGLKPVSCNTAGGILRRVLHCFSGQSRSRSGKIPILIMGHEFSGYVEKVGSKVSKVKAGDLVTVDPNDMCGNCYYCNNAMEQFCTNNIGIGTTVDGGFVEYCKVCDTQVFKYKDGIDAATAAMTEPVSCCSWQNLPVQAN